MILRDISFETPSENILFDEVLLDLAEENGGPETLRFWESQTPFVVLGRISKISEDVELEKAKKDHIPVLRRCSGGGTVLQGPGCLNYTFILSKDKHPLVRDLRQSYEFILNKVVKALLPTGIESIALPISDIALKKDHRKFSGNAQKRSKKFILHHGTILYNFDLKKIAHYLKMPSSIPEYRQGRPHDEFVTNIKISKETIKEALKKMFLTEVENNDVSSVEQKLLQGFLQTKNPVLD